MATFTNKTRGARENAVTGGVLSQQDRLFLEERFVQRPEVNGNIANDTANKNFETTGTGTEVVALSDGGGIKLTTGANDGDNAQVIPHLDSNQTGWTTNKWNTNDQVAWTAIIETDSSVADMIVVAGLKLTFVEGATGFATATDDDQTFFRYEDSVNGGRWQAIDSNNNTDNVQDTGITVAASTRYKLEIRIDDQRVPRYYINGVLVATGDALALDHDLIPYVGVESDVAATAKSIYLRYQSISKEYAN